MHPIDFLWEHAEAVSWVLATSFNYAVVLLLIRRILLQKRESGATLAWVFFVILVPYLGLIAFWLFGTTRLRMRRRKRRRAESSMAASVGPLVTALRAGAHEAPNFPGAPGLYRLSTRLAGGRGPTPGNRVDLYRDGPQVMRALEQSIEGASEHVHVQFYIWKNDASGIRLRDLLVETARRGVKVRLLLDDVGTRLPTERFFAPLLAAGGQVGIFLPVSLFSRRISINNRNHRKIVVVDGQVGFTGGMNVGDEYLGDGPGAWHDAFVRIAGPAALQLQEIFCNDWYHTTGEDVAHERTFPSLAPAGEEWVQILASGPADERWHSIQLLMFTAVNQAQERVWIETPYFVPDEALVMALQSAALRGVDVRLVVPAVSDHALVYYAGRSFYGEMLAAGVKIHEVPRMLHAKTLVVDHDVSTVGSTNMDRRSFRLNFEVNAFFYGRHMNAALARGIQEQFEPSGLLSRHRFAQRGRKARGLEALARVLSPLL